MPEPLVIESLEDLPPPRGPVALTVGTFDGVHPGHQALLARTIGLAREQGALAAAMTFRNHPRSVVSPANCPLLLTEWEEKKRLILKTGIELLVGLWFDEELRRWPAEDFVRETVVRRIGARTVVSGPNFHFGLGGLGNPALLARMAKEEGFRFICQEPVLVNGMAVSSTRIRETLAAGDVALAAKLLGRHYRLTGRVVPGDGLGRTIGFPTANMQPDAPMLIPKNGVYAVRVRLSSGAEYPGMMNIGVRPTVDGREHRREVHLLGFDGELEGNTLEVFFIGRLRDEVRFSGLPALREQLARDREAALAILQP